MKFLKRILCFMMCVVILSGTLGTKYFDSNHMEKVKAGTLVVAAAGISAATIAEICLFVGATALSAYGIYEGYENREEICRFGKEFIDSCSDTAEGWVMQVVDTTGQDYVFGTEALELVRDTEWSVIQGGLPPEGDPNKKDDKDKDKFHIPGDPMTHIAQFTALGATWFTTNAQNIYQDWCDILDGWVGKDTPIPENNPLVNNFSNSFTGFEKNAEGLYSVSGYCHINYKNGVHVYDRIYNNFQPISKKVVLYKNGTQYNVICKTNNATGYEDYNLTCTLRTNDSYYGSAYEINTYSRSYFGYFGTLNSWSFNVNLPIYATQTEAAAALATDDFTGALNYGKEYRIADWLQQDWTGELIDPLVNIGLSLSQLIDLMKALGLKTLQGLSAAELLELLKNVLPKLDPALLPGATPTPIVVDPAVDPIYYPDPDAHPDKPPRPVIDPDPAQNPNPDPDPGTDPNPDPDPGADPVPLPDMDAADYKVDLKSIFPFCIPFDFVALLRALDAEPRAPCFTFPVVIPALNYREDVELDLSIFDDVAKVVRLCEKVSFLIFLMFVTSKVIRW